MESVSDLISWDTYKELLGGCKKVAKVQFLKMVLHFIHLSISSMANQDGLVPIFGHSSFGDNLQDQTSLMPKTAMALTIATSILGEVIGSRTECYRLRSVGERTVAETSTVSAGSGRALGFGFIVFVIDSRYL
ncbi:Uncharacterized protein Rs2_15718 [Raphanus sativus]|nr:Uncharacterized protein Rs2_15718 [Raphanus sativus]